MGKVITVKNKYCTFYLEAKKVFVKLNDGINPTFVLETADPRRKTPIGKLKDAEWLDVVDMIYRRKITDRNKFNELIYNRYRLTATGRKF